MKETQPCEANLLNDSSEFGKFGKIVIFQVFSLLIVTGIRIFHLTAQFSRKRELSMDDFYSTEKYLNIKTFSNEVTTRVETRRPLKPNQKGQNFKSEKILSL